MRKDVLVNLNFPDCAPEEVKGIAVAPLGRRRQERLHIDKRLDGRGNPVLLDRLFAAAHRCSPSTAPMSRRSRIAASR